VEKGKMEASEKEAVLARIKGTTNMADLADVDFVIEAVLEVMDLKKKVFQELDEICRPGVVLASNTSSMSLSHKEAREGMRHAFFQPGSPDATRRGHPGTFHG